MKLKNMLYSLYALTAIGICCVPAVMMYKNYTDKSSTNAELAKFPKIKSGGSLNREFFCEFETWFSDHYAYREKFVTANANIMADVFNTSSNADVIMGKDGWLFYNHTVDDYTGLNTLSERGISNVAHNIQLMSEYCKENGADFIFAPAPNKNSIYPEYMPSRYYVTNNTKNIDAVKAKLDGSVGYCDWKNFLITSKDNGLLYHKTDSHWNNFGANLASRQLLTDLGKQFTPLFNTGTSYTWRGDLYKMLFPQGKELDMQVEYDGLFTFETVGRFRSWDDSTVNTECEGKEGRLLMFRDSFGVALNKFMANEFAEAEFSRVVPYRMQGIADGKFDCVVLEIVERNLRNLQKSAPVMPAPTAKGVNLSSPSVSADVYTEEIGGYLHIYGVLENLKKSVKSDTNIYVTVNGITYEAFRAYESDLLSGETGMTESDYGYSLYVPYVENAQITIAVG